MKPILAALALCVFLAPALAQPQDAPAPPETLAQTALKPIETDLGWMITPVVMPEDNAATMFGMKFWRFNVESPDKDLRGTCKLELRRDKQTPITIHQIEFVLRGGGNDEVTFGLMPVGDKPLSAEFTFGLMPIGDKPLWEADEMKLSEFIRTSTETPSINNSASVTVCKNPIKDIKRGTTMAGYAGTGTVNKDGSIVLTRFLGGDLLAARTITGGGSQLVLVFTASPKAE